MKKKGFFFNIKKRKKGREKNQNKQELVQNQLQGRMYGRLLNIHWEQIGQDFSLGVWKVVFQPEIIFCYQSNKLKNEWINE